MVPPCRSPGFGYFEDIEIRGSEARAKVAMSPASQRVSEAGGLAGLAGLRSHQKEAKDEAPRLVGAKTPLICEENWRAGRLRAERWGEKTADLSGDLGRKKAFDPKTALISAEISGIRRADPRETRSKLHIEAKIAAK